MFACVFFWNDFSHKKNQPSSQFLLLQSLNPPHPNSAMSSPVLTIVEGVKMKKQNKTKIGVGSVVKARVGELENITREGKSGGIRKEEVGCDQAVVGEKKFLFQSEYG